MLATSAAAAVCGNAADSSSRIPAVGVHIALPSQPCPALVDVTAVCDRSVSTGRRLCARAAGQESLDFANPGCVVFGFCSAALPEAPCAHWGICCAHAHCLGVHSGPSRRPLIPSSAFYPLLKARDAETCVVRSRARYASVQPGIFVMSTHMHLGRCPRVPVAASCSPTGHQFHRIDFTYLGLADTLLRPASSASNSWASCLVKLLSSISAGVWSLSSITSDSVGTPQFMPAQLTPHDPNAFLPPCRTMALCPGTVTCDIIKLISTVAACAPSLPHPLPLSRSNTAGR